MPPWLPTVVRDRHTLCMTATAGEPHDAANVVPQTQETTGRRRGRRPADTFAVRLILARHLEGVSIKEAAERTGLHYATWSTWERGRRPADILDVAQRIADALDIDEEWLLFGGPLEGPRGRRVRPSSDRSTPTILGLLPQDPRPIMGSNEGAGSGYSPSPNRPRPATTRPGTGRKKVRPDRRPSNQDESDRTRRPVRVG